MAGGAGARRAAAGRGTLRHRDIFFLFAFPANQQTQKWTVLP
jgi:hypothetical protein